MTNKFYNRLIAKEISETSKSVLLLGPRQVGKSTLIKNLNPDLTINLAERREFLQFSARPAELQERLQQVRPHTVFIDEIQRLPNLLNDIQAILDNNKNIKFYLTGSSARKLRRDSANLLPGRIVKYDLKPFSCAEFGYRMDLKTCLSVGTLPEPYLLQKSREVEKILETYGATYLQEEIAQETLIRQIEGFSRFLMEAATQSGRLLDFSKLSNKAKLSRSAVRRYFEILEETLICEKLEAYELPGVDLIKHPKFYFFDIGPLNGLLDNFTPSLDRKGALFEHLFFNQLRNTSTAFDKKIKISHFRTRGGSEIDFIVQIGNRVSAIELKTSMPDNTQLKALKAFQEIVPAAKLFCATAEDVTKRIDGVEILSWQEVIRKIFES